VGKCKREDKREKAEEGVGGGSEGRERKGDSGPQHLLTNSQSTYG